MANAERVVLGRLADGAVSWSYFREDGSFVAEFYDHSAETNERTGGDVALLLMIAPADLGAFGDALRERVRDIDTEDLTAEALLDAVERAFASYFELAAWVEARGVAHTVARDDWA